MSNVMRWRKETVRHVMSPPIQSHLLIEIGDLVYRSLNGHVYPASSLPDHLSEQMNRHVFTCQFLGVAMQESRVGDTARIRVATSGIFMFCVDALAAALILGQRFGASENAAGTGLRDQVIEAVNNDVETIAHLAEPATAGATCVWVDIKSTIMGYNVGVPPEICETSSSSG